MLSIYCGGLIGWSQRPILIILRAWEKHESKKARILLDDSSFAPTHHHGQCQFMNSEAGRLSSASLEGRTPCGTKYETRLVRSKLSCIVKIFKLSLKKAIPFWIQQCPSASEATELILKLFNVSSTSESGELWQEEIKSLGLSPCITAWSNA